MTKKCAKCKQFKSFEEFPKKKTCPDGLYNYCKICKARDDKIVYEKNKTKRLKSAKIYYENNKEKILSNIDKEKRKEIKKKWDKENKEWSKQYAKQWREDNREWVNERKRKYRSKNRDYWNKVHRDWLKNNPLAKLAKSCRNRLWEFINERGYMKNKKFLDILGCSLEELKDHLETRFKPGMTWDNHGEWHIDHIIPLAFAKTEEDVYKLCHYTNLQPLWATENLKKNKF